jgi:predicted ferric reductase
MKTQNCSSHFSSNRSYTAHYGLVKFNFQEENVSADDPNFRAKCLITPFAFVSKHAILFQMALIPLTMSRFSISSLSESILNRFIPLNEVLRIHAHLGYTMTIITFIATFYFFTFFGYLCADGDQPACTALTSEIMITGYTITVLMILITGIAAFRNRIPYEVFYYTHHLVFILYAVVVLHTYDNQQRKHTHEKERSQTYKWFTATM